MPILTTVGLLQGGQVTAPAREAFVDAVNAILLNGPRDVLFGALPPVVVFPGNKFLSNSFTVKPIEKHQTVFPVWHKVFIDSMFQATANALNVDGATPLAPVVDYTVPFKSFGFPMKQLSIPQFAIGMALVDPTFQAQLQYFFDVDAADITPDLLAKLLISAPIPKPPIPPIPPIPPLPTDFAFDVPFGLPKPEIPPLVISPIPPLEFDITLPLPVIGFLSCAVLKALPLIFAVLLAKAIGGELLEALSKGAPGLIAFVTVVVIDAILSCLGIELKNVLTFLAGFIVYIERLVQMLVVVLVGVVFGEGMLVKLVAAAVGLV